MSGGTLADRVRAAGGIAPGTPAVVAFSGGRDSLCLLDLAAAIAGPPAVLAVHVHHGLRGRDADEDACAAAALARRLGVAVRVVRLAPPDDLRTHGGVGRSPVVWARAARRAALRRLADDWAGPGTGVLLGHTASDQAETVLLRAISSPGARALAGIAEEDPDRGVHRPLLRAGTTRAETGAWCAARGLSWRDDPTNPGSPRGRVRALLASLEAVDDRATAALVRTAARAREDEQALMAAAARLVAHDGTIRLELLATTPPAVARRALRVLAEDAAGTSCPRAGGRLEEVLALGRRAGGGGALDVGHGVRVEVGDGLVRCGRSPSRLPPRARPEHR